MEPIPTIPESRSHAAASSSAAALDILLLAPHPFYQDRGTPIAVGMLLEALSARGERTTVVTYHEGAPVEYVHVTLHRIARLPGLSGIRPGFSFKKLACDVLMLAEVLRLLRRRRFDLVHAIEESAYIALIVKWIYGIPYIYDMDSSLVRQLIERFRPLVPFRRVLEVFERTVIRNAKVVVPVCDSLGEAAARDGADKIVVVQDVSILKDAAPADPPSPAELPSGCKIVMYVGNLEPYQGIDLLLESFARVAPAAPEAALVIIGGRADDVRRYQTCSRELGLDGRVRFLGSKPVDQLSLYLKRADILASPRIQGTNTPMKLYSYLHSGRPILATALPTHTQVLDDAVALLAAPTPEAFADGMLRLLRAPELGATLGAAGKRRAEERHSRPIFTEKVNRLFDDLRAELRPCGPSSAADRAR